MCVHNNRPAQQPVVNQGPEARDRGNVSNPQNVARGPEARGPARTGQTQIQQQMQRDSFECAKPRAHKHHKHHKHGGFFHKLGHALGNAFKGAFKLGGDLLGGALKLGGDFLQSFLGQQQQQAQQGLGLLSGITNVVSGILGGL